MNLARAREFAILSLLCAHPAHGYDIARAMAAEPLSLLGLSRPAVYAILDRFEKRGWVSGEQVQSGSYPDKTVMSLTDAGNEALRRMIRDIRDLPDLPVAPFMALCLAHDAGTPFPPEFIARMIDDRRQRLAAIADDSVHATSASSILAVGMIKAELATLEALEPPRPVS